MKYLPDERKRTRHIWLLSKYPFIQSKYFCLKHESVINKYFKLHLHLIPWRKFFRYFDKKKQIILFLCLNGITICSLSDNEQISFKRVKTEEMTSNHQIALFPGWNVNIHNSSSSSWCPNGRYYVMVFTFLCNQKMSKKKYYLTLYENVCNWIRFHCVYIPFSMTSSTRF